MAKKIKIEILELEALAEVIGKPYGSLRVKIGELYKKQLPLEFGENGRYKLFGQPGKKWFAYDSEKYEISVLTADDIEQQDSNT